MTKKDQTCNANGFGFAFYKKYLEESKNLIGKI